VVHLTEPAATVGGDFSVDGVSAEPHDEVWLDIGLRPGVRGEVADLREQVGDRRHREDGETDLDNRFGGQPRRKTTRKPHSAWATRMSPTAGSRARGRRRATRSPTGSADGALANLSVPSGRLSRTTPAPKRSVSDELLFGEDVAENSGGVIEAGAVAV